MAIYAIGDVQGCYDELQRLLELIRFDPAQDRLWFVGDLVNRGPQSLATLRLLRSLGDKALSVLGNHDLHLLAVACGAVRSKRRDTLHDIIDAPDAAELLDWLRACPLAHYADEILLVHAGVPPQWDVTLTLQCAGEVETMLQAPNYADFMLAMYGDEPALWRDDLSGTERLRFITNCLTRLRYCNAQGRLDLKQKVRQAVKRKAYYPGSACRRRTRGTTIVFGHWSTLGFSHVDGCYGIDTGCLWGGSLLALRLEDKAYFRTPSLHPVAIEK